MLIETTVKELVMGDFIVIDFGSWVSKGSFASCDNENIYYDGFCEVEDSIKNIKHVYKHIREDPIT